MALHKPSGVDIRPGDRVEIKAMGITVIGKVESASGNALGNSSNWCIELIDERTGDPYYWKQQSDGGTVRNLQGGCAEHTGPRTKYRLNPDSPRQVDFRCPGEAWEPYADYDNRQEAKKRQRYRDAGGPLAWQDQAGNWTVWKHPPLPHYRN